MYISANTMDKILSVMVFILTHKNLIDKFWKDRSHGIISVSSVVECQVICEKTEGQLTLAWELGKVLQVR